MRFKAALPPVLWWIGAAAAGPCLALLCSFARLDGGYVPAVNGVTADYLWGVIAAAILGLTVLFWPVAAAERRACVLLWIVRIVTCLLLMLPYEARYELLDAYGYVANSLQPATRDSVVGIALGTQLIEDILRRLWEFLPISYHLAKILFAYLGLLAVVLFYKVYAHLTDDRRIAPLYIVGLFPSVLFWSSILGKDPLVLFGIAMVFYAGTDLLEPSGASRRKLVLFFVGLAIASAVRFWIGAMLLASFSGAWVAERTGATRRLAPALVLLSVVGVLLAGSFHYLQVSGGAQLLFRVEALSNSWSTGGSAGKAVEFDSWYGVLEFLPLGVVTALFRPMPGEVSNAFGWMAGFENLGLVAIAIVTVVRWRLVYFRRTATLWLLLFLMNWALMYAFISYQNLGTAVRFRAQVLPVMLILFGVSMAGARRAREAGAPAIERARQVDRATE